MRKAIFGFPLDEHKILGFSLDVKYGLKYTYTLLKMTNSAGIANHLCQGSLGLGLNENTVWTARAVTQRNSVKY